MLKKKIQKVVFTFFIIMLLFVNKSIATEEILEEQMETLNIKSFVDEANEYTKEVFTGIDTKDLINDAIKGKIDNKTIINKVINLFGKEIRETLRIIRKHYLNNSHT